MCGVAGFLNTSSAPASRDVLERMLDTIEHRGPDDRGFWIEDGIALGHQRLSILDLSDRGHQPFVTEDGKGIIVYNGEVYNYPDLRSQLQHEGLHFYSTCDTEVVLKALHHWGPEKAIPLFNGMFAFAYLDKRSATLTLARDRLGIKPLYVAKTENTIVFGSEVKALLAHPGVGAIPDKHSLTLYALLFRFEGGVTPFEGIESLRPGSYWRINQGNISKVIYFDVLRDLNLDRMHELAVADTQQVLDECKEILSDSVRIHLASDAPLATMCSGGLDSSLITALTKTQRPDVVSYVADVKTAISEGAIAARVGKHLNVQIRQVDVDLEDLLRLWPEATWHGDMPNTHANDMPMLAVARACRRDGIKVVLTGEGSDELFGGYSWQAGAYQNWRRWRKHPISRLNLGNRWTRGLASLIPHRFHMDEPDIEDPFSRYLGSRRRGAGLRMLFPFDPNRQTRGAELFRKLEGVDKLEERAFLARALDDTYGHLESLLMRNDRMGMAASIETRTPFIENRLIELGIHAPFRVKLNNGQGKWVIKKIGEKFLPHDIVYQPKLGFPTSFDYVKYGLPLLERGTVSELFKWTPSISRRMVDILPQDPAAMWNILCIEIWGRLFLRGESRIELGEQLVRNWRDSRAAPHRK